MKREVNEHYLKKELYDLIKTDETLFDFIQEGSLDGMWYWNLEKIEDEWLSPRFWEVLGYDPKKKKHSSLEWQDIIFKADLKEATKNFEKHLQDPKHPYDQIVRYRHKNGSNVWIRCRGIAIRDVHGKAIRMLGAHTNITDQQNQIMELNQLTEMIQQLLATKGEGIDYQKISNAILKITSAKFVAFNLYDEDGKHYSTKAYSGNEGSVKKAMDIMGMKLDKRKWNHDFVRADKIKDKNVTRFSTLNDLVGEVIPKSICTLLTKRFNLGQTVLVKIMRDQVMLGDFTLLMQKGDLFDKDNIVERYANEIGIALVNERTNKKLKESEEKYRDLFEQSVMGIFVHDMEGRITNVNNRACLQLKYTKEELLKLTIFDIHPNEAGTVNLPKDEILRQWNHWQLGQQTVFEGEHQCKDGTIIPVRISTGPVEHKEGKRILAVVQDITEINIANKKLIKSEEQYRLLTSEMQLGLALHETIFDDKGKPIDYRFISVNSSFEHLTGLKSEDILGKTILEVLPSVEKYWIEAYGDIAVTGKSIQYENYSKELGKYFNTSAYSPKKGQFAVIVEDITERVLIEKQRVKAQKDLLTSQKIAKLGTWRLDVKTNEISMSEELYKLYGFDPTQPAPPYTEHMKIFTKQSWDNLSSALALTSTKGIPYEMELEMAIGDKPKGWMWVKGEAEYDDQGQIVSLIGLAQDITERKQLEENLKEAHQIAKLGRWELIHNENQLIWSETIFDIFEIDSKRFESSYEGFLKVIHPDDCSTVDEAYKKSLINKQAYSIEHRLLMDDGRIKWVSEKCNTEFDEKGQPIRSIGVVQDITDKKIKEEENIYIANHDYLTSLYNRRYFVNAFDTFTLKGYSPLGMMMIDINGLKIINDAYGHVRGDEAIKQVANLLMEVFDQDDVVARIGGDEFAILTHCKNASQLQDYKDKLVFLSQDIKINNIPVSLAIGYEVFSDNDKGIDELLIGAEKQLYRHKITVGDSGRNHSIKAILNTLTDKYKEEKIHSTHVSQLCKQIGVKLGLNKEDIDILELAGMYHDIGKISIPDAILNKPDKLPDEEYDIIKTHTQIGYQILKAADEYSGLAEYALSHHERWDGRGYPKGLKGKNIPLFSRIINVADSFEAMTADRPYRKGMPIEDAILEIKRCSGSQFDPEIANIFLEKVLKDNR